MEKRYMILLLSALILASLFPVVSAEEYKCTDDTPYGKCNAQTYQYCWGVGSSGQLIYYPKICAQQLGGGGCPAGYEPSADLSTCTLTGCTEPTTGKVIPKNTCSTNKPYYCNNGVLVKNPSLCGCPEANQEVRNGECALKIGCVYHNSDCASNQDCNATSNQCVTKTGCTYDYPACGSDSYCVDNACVKKSGCAYDNPACGSDQVCDTSKVTAGVCTAVTSAAASTTPTNQSASGPLCGVLLAIPALLGAGYFYSKKK